MNKIELNKIQKEVAMKRIENLTKRFKLNNKMSKDFKNGIINFTCFEKMYNLADFPKLEKLVKNFEKEYDCLVYHCILSKVMGMEMFALLFVSKYDEEWETDDNFYCDYYNCYYIPSYVVNLTYNGYSEFGDIIVSSKNGYLFRNE